MPGQSGGPGALLPLAKEALDLVLREAPLEGAVRLTEDREYDGEDPIPMLWLGPSGTMLHVDAATLPALVVAIADALQEMVIESKFYATGRADLWPQDCPLHPGTHPPQAAERDGAAWWTCPRNDAPLRPIGG